MSIDKIGIICYNVYSELLRTSSTERHTMLTAGTAWALVLLIIVVALAIVSVYMIRHTKMSRYQTTSGWALILLICGVFVAGIAFGTFPQLPQYHVLDQHTGKVVKVAQRIITADTEKANLTKEIAFWMEGETEAYYTDDVRLTNLTEGQTLTIQRWDTWVYGGENYWKTIYVSAPIG